MNRKIITIAAIAAIVIVSAVIGATIQSMFTGSGVVQPVAPAIPHGTEPATEAPAHEVPATEVPTHEVPTAAAATEEKTEKREIVLVRGILMDYLEAGNNPQDIHRKPIAQRVVPAMSWRNHIVKHGFPMQGYHTYMRIERDGNYVFQVRNYSENTRIYATLLINGVRHFAKIDQWSPVLEVPVHLSAGVHEVRLFIAFNARISHAIPNFKIKFGIRGAERDLDNYALPNLYQLFYDRNELTNPVSALERVYTFEDERRPKSQ